MEDSPERNANENVAQLTKERTHTENRVSLARQSYNDLMMAVVTYRQSFPTILFASTFGYAED